MPCGQVMCTLTRERSHKLWILTIHSGTKRFANRFGFSKKNSSDPVSQGPTKNMAFVKIFTAIFLIVGGVK